jgi:membrane-associated phospholipid phosphatase
VFAIVAFGAVAAAARQGRPFERWWGHGYAPQAVPAAARDAANESPADALERLHHWNHVAIDASGLDHTPDNEGLPHVFGEQIGPGRASRAMAIVHIAMFEAMNAIDPRFESYLGMPRVAGDASMDAAIAQAAHDTLVALYPSQAEQCHALLAEDLSHVPDGAAKEAGLAIGRFAASAILQRRDGDGSEQPEQDVNVDYVPGNAPGEWRQDPISQRPVALGVTWGEVAPFVLASVKPFRVPPPPPLQSREYAIAFDEVQHVGRETESARTADQTLAAIYWAYDGTPSLCAPPRLYNQIALTIAAGMGSDAMDQARLLALINVAMADAAIAIWESKYHYKFWRPVTAIREADEGTGPTGIGDRNDKTVGDPRFSPLGAPASNLSGKNFTPPFPSYPSGHAGFGGALFQMLRNFYGTDDIPFTFVSDELNGVTRGNDGNVRPLLPRSFDTLSQAEDENGQSRVYLGIHWSFDKEAGIAQGRRVADYVFRHVFTESRRGNSRR